MTLAQLVPLALQVSIALIVLALGLETRAGDLSYLIRRPWLCARSVLAMNVVMPLLTTLILRPLDLRPEVKVALVLLAVSPVPPILPQKHAKAGGNLSYAIGLLVISSVVSIVTVPASVALIAGAFGRAVEVPMALIAKTVILSVLGPLVVGALVQRAAPSFADKAVKPASIAGTVLLPVAFIPVVIGSWHAVIGEMGHGTLVAIVAFTLAGLLVGHMLGGPVPENRTVLGLSTAVRHPGVATAIAGAVAQDTKGVAAAVLLCLIVSAVVTAPYVSSRKRAATAAIT